MQTLQVGIAILLSGILLSTLPMFGVSAGALATLGWVLVVLGATLAAAHLTREWRARRGFGGPGRPM